MALSYEPEGTLATPSIFAQGDWFTIRLERNTEAHLELIWRELLPELTAQPGVRLQGRRTASRLFENISGDIVLMAIPQRHVAPVESGLCQRLARLLQDMALGFPFLPDPGFLLITQLHAQLRLGGRTLRSAMLQQLPGHGLEHVKEGDDDIRCSAQERTNILNHAMGVLGLVNSQKKSNSGLLGRTGQTVRLSTSHSPYIDDSRGLPGTRPSQLPEARVRNSARWSGPTLLETGKRGIHNDARGPGLPNLCRLLVCVKCSRRIPLTSQSTLGGETLERTGLPKKRLPPLYFPSFLVFFSRNVTTPAST